jgi:hypothetical protein
MLRRILARPTNLGTASVPDNGQVVTWANGEAAATYTPSGSSKAGTLTVWLLRYSKQSKPAIWRTHQTPRRRGDWVRMVTANGKTVLTASYTYGGIGPICVNDRYAEVRDPIHGTIALPIAGLPGNLFYGCP